MLTALPYDISLSNFDTEVFSPKCIHQYSSLPSWWLSFTNQSVFIPGCTWMQTTFSFQTVLFCRVQHVFLLRRHCAPPSEFVTNGELMVHEIYPKQNRRVTEALEGCTASHGRWSIDMKKGTGTCPSALTSTSLLTSDYFIRFPLSAFIPKLIYRVLQNPFSTPALR